MDFSNIFVIIFIVSLLLSMVTKVALDLNNYFYRKKRLGIIPDILKEHIDKEKMIQIDRYANDKLVFETVTNFADKILLICLLVFGFYPFLYKWISAITTNPYILCFLFFAAGAILDTIISIPFSLFFNFVIEKKHGFNKMTFGTWITDLIKELLVSAVVGVIILIPFMFLVLTFKNMWWLLVWGMLIAFSLIMQIVYPILIAPLFNKFKPVEDDELKNSIEKLLTKTGYGSKGVYEMDASKRSGHSNAYFTGLGKVKKIVLFDTLIKSMSIDELSGVLAHEIGHYKKKHIVKGLILSSVLSLVGFYVAYLITTSNNIYNGFGFTGISPENSVYIGLFLVSIVAGPVMFFTKPIFSYISRKNEFEADKYSGDMTEKPEALCNALIKLNIENMSNLYPSPLYVKFYYSHPPLLERIAHLKK